MTFPAGSAISIYRLDLSGFDQDTAKIKSDLAEIQRLVQSPVATLALIVVDQHGWSLIDATRWATQRMEEARGRYRAAGAPLGDTEAGFMKWLQPRHRPLIA